MKDRKTYIDVARGIGIILMVLGHIGLGDKFYTSVYSFHMPLFFFISGLLFTIPNKEKLLKRCKSLIIPYISLGATLFLLDWALGGFDFTKLQHLLWDNSNGLPVESALWFLTAMLTCQLVYIILDKMIRNDVALLLCSCAISIITCFVTNHFGIILPFSIQAGLVGMAYFSVGRFLANKKVYDGKTVPYAAISFCLIPALLVIATFLPLHNMRSGLYGIVPIAEIIALILCACVVYISKFVPNKLGKMITHYGKNSIIYLGINHLGIKISGYLVSLIPFINNQIVFKLAQIVLCFAILFVATILINKTPIRKLFGMK